MGKLIKMQHGQRALRGRLLSLISLLANIIEMSDFDKGACDIILDRFAELRDGLEADSADDEEEILHL